MICKLIYPVSYNELFSTKFHVETRLLLPLWRVHGEQQRKNITDFVKLEYLAYFDMQLEIKIICELRMQFVKHVLTFSVLGLRITRKVWNLELLSFGESPKIISVIDIFG